MSVRIRQAKVLENSEIARASRCLVLRPEDAEPLAYEPGNVLSLFVSQEGQNYRHAYTVTHCDPEKRSLSIIYRVIPEGRMTPVLETLEKGDALGFEGVYHNPIAREISPNPRGIVGITTGTGVGPFFGFATKVLKEGSVKVPITLYAGYREEMDLCLAAELDSLADQFPNFSWQATLSKPSALWKGLRGRVTQSVPPLLKPWQDLHFHLIGNGAMLRDYYEGLQRAGVPEARLSSETYFNWDGEFDEKAAAWIAAELGKA